MRVRIGPFMQFFAVIVALMATVVPAHAQASGSLVQWGSTFYREDLNAPAAAERFSVIETGYLHNLALRSDGSLVQWGNVEFSQATNAPPPAGPYMAVSAGGYHSLALRADGSLVQWGSTGFDQTGNAPPAAGPYRAIAAGGFHNLALRADGSLVQWGDTERSQDINPPPAAGPFIAISAGEFHNLALRPDGSLVQWGDASAGQANNVPPVPGPYVAIAAGGFHNLALRADGTLVQWGDTNSGQALNAPAPGERFIAIAAGYNHSVALRADGSLVQWGQTNSGQLANAPPAAGPYSAVAAGFVHSLALRGLPPGSVSFTYQGRLSGQTGPVDLRFAVFNSATGGTRLGALTAANGVTPDAQGLFTATVTPGAIDASSALWLEVAVAPAGSGSFTTLSPRQAITRAPQASFADRAGIATSAASAIVANFATNAGTATTATNAASATNAVNAMTAANATNAQSAPWSGLTGQAAVSTGAIGTGWQLLFNNSTSTFRGGMRLADSGFFEVTNGASLASPSFARLSSAGAWTAVSDARLKTDVTSAEGNLAAALKLRPVNFRWKGGGTEDFGLIAQEVREVLPRLVIGDETKDSLTVNYSQLSVVAIGAIQELKADNDRKQREIDVLRARLDRIEEALRTEPAIRKP